MISVLAAKRLELQGGMYSTAGKRVEEPLTLTLCNLFQVPPQFYASKGLSRARREVDFHLIGKEGMKYRCEVKLMSKGNPESADAAIARDTNIFVANKLSALNKEQLTNLGVHWVELRSENGYQRFAQVLRALDIPHLDRPDDLEILLPKIFREIFPS